jgi:ketosteroid isomerase-like protein
MSEANKQTVQEIYTAFGRGDVAFIQSRVAEGTRWDFSAQRDDIPWHAPVESKGGLPAFFGALAENVGMEAFEPKAFAVCGREVVVKVRIAYRLKRTGRRVDQEQVHWWSFDDGGRVVSLRHYEDTAAVRDAWGG